MTKPSGERATVLGQVYRLRWQIAVPACVLLLLALLLFDADALIWLLGFCVALLFWSPIVAAWWRGGRQARTAFREGLDDK